MNKIILSGMLAFLLCLVPLAIADNVVDDEIIVTETTVVDSVPELSIGDTLKKLPGLKQGIAYSFIDNKISYLTTIEVMNWKGLGLEMGYSSTDKAVGVVSYELMKLSDFGVDVPLLNLINARVGLYAGYGRLGFVDGDDVFSEGNNEFDTGLSLTLIDIKF